MTDFTLINDDCLNAMSDLIGGGAKVDLVLTDLPYGTIQCKWDNPIPFDEMWSRIHDLTYTDSAILLFGQEPFSSNLRLSNLKDYRYDWIWNKTVGTNFLNANRMPLPCHEIISVFYKKLPKYNPQKKYVGIKYNEPITSKRTNNCYGELKRKPYVDDGYRFPLSVIEFKNNQGECSQSNRVHPTQKPVELLEYLIKTYSDEGDIVLDFTMGSGSTGVACKNLNRNFIGIELDKEYFKIAEERINNCQTKLM